MNNKKRVCSICCQIFFALFLCSCGNSVDNKMGNVSSENDDKKQIYIPIIAKGWQQQYWQSVKMGAEMITMKKILPYMILSFTLYSADPGEVSAKQQLQVAATSNNTQPLQSTNITTRRGLQTSTDLELRKNNSIISPVIMGPVVAGYALLEDLNARDILLGAAFCGLVFQQLQILGLMETVDKDKKEQLGLLNKFGTLTKLMFEQVGHNVNIVDEEISGVKRRIKFFEQILIEHTHLLLRGDQRLTGIQNSVHKVATVAAINNINIGRLFDNQKNGLVRIGYLEGQISSVFELIRGSESTVHRRAHR